jgi:hypothetical protein
MFGKIVSAFVVVAVMGSLLFANEKAAKINVGDHLFIQMTGELAKEYSRRTTSQKKMEKLDGIQISTSAMVSQQLEDGRYRIEHTSHIVTNNKSPRLITLTAIIDSANVKQDVVLKNTPVYGSPADHQKGVKPTLTQNDSPIYRLELSDLKSVKLQTWELAEENGN